MSAWMWLASHRPRTQCARLRQDVAALRARLVAIEDGLLDAYGAAHWPAKVAEHEARLNAQDEAWEAWRSMSGKTPPPSQEGLYLVKGGAS